MSLKDLQRDFSKELLEFVKSEQFANFRIIMEQMAYAKFSSFQNDKDVDPISIVANKKVINRISTLPELLELSAKQAIENKVREAENNEEIK